MTGQLRSLLVFMIATTVSAVPGFAQTDSAGALLMLARSSSTAVGFYDASLAPALDRLPANFVVTRLYAPVIEQLLRESPTFRRQCARVASAPHLMVTIAAEPPRPLHRSAALTRVARYEAGRLVARISIPTSSSTAELIAHELEHVLEQLDGIDLSAKSRLRATGVRSCDCGESAAVYETARAIAAGRRVAGELGRPVRR